MKILEYWQNDIPKKVRQMIIDGWKANSQDYSVHKNGYAPVKAFGKFAMNNVPVEHREDFIEYFYGDINKFKEEFKNAKKNVRNNKDLHHSWKYRQRTY